jgi:hypothetical protein
MPTVPLNPEGGKAAQVLVRVPRSTKDRLDAIAETAGVTVATVARTAVDEFLARFDPGDVPCGPPGRRRRLRAL